MKTYRIVREWYVEAENADDALMQATPGTHTDVHVTQVPMVPQRDARLP